MPKDRYRLYHVEKAKGGLGMTMTAGTAVVSPDSPPAFGNLHAYDDAIVPWIRAMTDGIHEHGAAAMIQISHLGRRTGWAQDDWLPVVAPSALREPAHRDSPEGGRGLGHRPHRRPLRRRRRADEGRRDGRHRDRGLRPPVRPVLVAATNQRTTSTAARSTNRLRFPWRCCAPSASGSAPTTSSASAWPIDETRRGRDRRAGRARDPAAARARRADRLRQRHPRQHRQRRGAHRSDPDPRHARRRRTSTSPAWCAQHTGLAVLHASKIDDVATARHAIREGMVDMVGMTRAHIADPHLVRKIDSGSRGRDPAVRRRHLLPRPHLRSPARRCASTTRRRAASRRCRTTSRRAESARRVVIVGAGPGGLEAARGRAASAATTSSLLEAMPWAGGQIRSRRATRGART